MSNETDKILKALVGGATNAIVGGVANKKPAEANDWKVMKCLTKDLGKTLRAMEASGYIVRFVNPFDQTICADEGLIKTQNWLVLGSKFDLPLELLQQAEQEATPMPLDLTSILASSEDFDVVS